MVTLLYPETSSRGDITKRVTIKILQIKALYISTLCDNSSSQVKIQVSEILRNFRSGYIFAIYSVIVIIQRKFRTVNIVVSIEFFK